MSQDSPSLAVPGPHVILWGVNRNLASLAGSQRSRVVNVWATFSEAVDVDEGGLRLALHLESVSYDGVAQPTGFGTLPSTVIAASDDAVTWTLTWTGNTDNGADFSSIRDGVYDLVVAPSKVRSVATGNPAEDWLGVFYRLFGEVTGVTVVGSDYTAVVNSGDNFQFQQSLNAPANYKASLDFNGDGVINSGDSLQFSGRFNKPLCWSVST